VVILKIMRRIVLILTVLSGIAAFAQEEEQDWQRYPYTLGAGLEMNMNTRTGWAQGYSAIMDRHLFDRHFAAGIRIGMHNDYNGISSLEGSFFTRLYPYKLGLGGAFVQLGWGVISFQEDELRPMTVLFDFTTGFRFFFLKGFYVEADIRTGYPLQWAFGLSGGHRFSF
jgi:hypothetical protein